MDRKYAIALVAIIAIGIFALPSTVALFAGQHSFYNIDATGNQVPCTKCHGDVKAELGSNVNTNPAAGPLTDGPHKNFKCEYCHRIEQGSSSGDSAYGKVPYMNSTGKTARYVLIPVADMEAGNLPATISSAEVYIGNDTLAGVKLRYGKGVIGPVYAGADAALGLTVGNKPDWRIVPTYNLTSGLPLDTNGLTKDGGLDLSKATVGSTGTVSLVNAGSKSVNPGSAYHAASLVSCMECHGGEEPMGHYSRVADATQYAGRPCSDCHYGGGGANPGGARMTTLQAGGFGLNAGVNDTGVVEGHTAWVKSTQGILRFGSINLSNKANNDACVGCHTHVAVSINFDKKYALTFDANATGEHAWDVGTASAAGNVAIDIYGNGTGGAIATSNKTYNWGSNGLYIVGTGEPVVGLVNDNSDSNTSLTT